MNDFVFVGGSFLNAGNKTAYRFSEFDNRLLPVQATPAVSDVPTISFFPSPVHDAATAMVDVSGQSDVTVRISDDLGRTVSILYDGPLNSGSNTIRWQASSFQSGVYLLTISCAAGTRTKRVLITH